MTTPNELLRDHEATYHSFVKSSFRSLIAIIVVLGVMAIFLT